MHTEIRALKRSEFEQQMKEKEKAENEMRRELEAKLILQEQQERQRLRALTNFKVQPIKHYKPIEIKPSEKPLTDPIAPWKAASTSHSSQH
jgi:targeting protein for Xklp2